MKPFPRPIAELIAYGAAAFVALLVDVALLAALVELAHWHYLPAASLAFVAGGVVLYFLCVRFVFRYRRISNAGLELLYFVSLGLVGLAVNALVMFVAIEVFGLHYLLAKGVSCAITFFTNFVLRRQLLFVSSSG